MAFCSGPFGSLLRVLCVFLKKTTWYANEWHKEGELRISGRTDGVDGIDVWSLVVDDNPQATFSRPRPDEATVPWPKLTFSALIKG